MEKSTSPVSSEESRKIDTKFRKRRLGLFKKAYELGMLCGADICLIVHRNEKYYVYKSRDDPLWPPSLQNIVGLHT